MRFPSLVTFAVLLLIVLSFPVGIVSCRPIEQPVAGAPNITIEIHQDIVEVDVEPGSDGKARFSGTVYCDMPPSTPPGQYCVVQLSADAGGWPCSNPEALVFDRTKTEEDFALTVQVPIETSQRTEGQLSVSGRWSYSPGAMGGTVPAATSIIRILMYSSLQVSAGTGNNTVPVGKWGELPVLITNGGNANDNIDLWLSDVPDGVDAYLTSDNIMVPEKQTQTVILKVKQSSGSPRTHRIVVHAKGGANGTNSESQRSIVFDTTISARSFFTTPYIIVPLIILMAIGGIVTYRMIQKSRRKKFTAREMV
ncbi:MAG: choice-of-anchor T family protein [Thermoplasmatota archaeon]